MPGDHNAPDSDTGAGADSDSRILHAQTVETINTECLLPYLMAMNWDAERRMARDVEENREMYEALAGDDGE